MWPGRVRPRGLARPAGDQHRHRPLLSLFTFALADRCRDRSAAEPDQRRWPDLSDADPPQGRYVIRVQVGQFDCTRDDVMTVAQVVHDLIGVGLDSPAAR